MASTDIWWPVYQEGCLTDTLSDTLSVTPSDFTQNITCASMDSVGASARSVPLIQKGNEAIFRFALASLSKTRFVLNQRAGFLLPFNRSCSHPEHSKSEGAGKVAKGTRIHKNVWATEKATLNKRCRVTLFHFLCFKCEGGKGGLCLSPAFSLGLPDSFHTHRPIFTK
jgi:hypothetical protein